MKVIIAGSRTITDMKVVFDAIAESDFEITEGVCSGARGVDDCGKQYCLYNNIPCRIFQAKWDDWKGLLPSKVKIRKNRKGLYNALAGINRNKKMADYSEALIAVIENNSPGTRDMIRRAKIKNLKIFIKEIDNA